MSGTLCGAKVGRDALLSIPIPEPTKSFVPVAHADLADSVKRIGTDVLHDFEFYKEEYALARDGNHMFGVTSFKGPSDETGLSIGFRNSYDKSLSIGITIGASVFVCSNLVMNGDITVMRKHTSNVLMDLNKLILNVIYEQRGCYIRANTDMTLMKDIGVDDDYAYRAIGWLYGHGVLSPRQIPVVKKEWVEPSHDEFSPRTLWSFYNAVTEALKSCNPAQIMNKHIQLHEMFFPKREVA